MAKFDIEEDPAMDVLTRGGQVICYLIYLDMCYIFLNIFNGSIDLCCPGARNILRLKTNGLGWFAPICSSFVAACYSVSLLGMDSFGRKRRCKEFVFPKVLNNVSMV